MRHVKKRLILVAFFLLMFFSLYKINGEAEEGESPDIELVVLLDTSESMNKDGIWEKVKIWTEDIGAFSLRTDIFLHVICFDGKNFDEYGRGDPNIREVFTGKVDDEEKLRSYGNDLQDIEAKGGLTDHKGALECVLEKIKDGDGSQKCVIIISDGDLDYDNKEGHSSIESEAIDEFGKCAKEFAMEENQSVVFVGFGSGKNLFQKIANGDGITYFDGDNESSDAIRRIFQKLGYPVEALDNSGSENELKFTVPTDCYRVIINIRPQEQAQEELNKEKITVSGPGEWVGKDYAYSSLKKSGYLYLNNIVQGEYTVTLPDGHWRSSITCQRFTLPDEISIRVLQNGQEVEKDQGTDCYIIQGKSFKIEYAGQNMSGTEVSYICYLEEDTSGNTNEPMSLLTSDYSDYRATIELEQLKKVYIVQIICKQGGKESRSAEIRIYAEESPIDTGTDGLQGEDRKTYEKIELKPFLENLDNCQLSVNGENENTAALENSIDNDELEYSGKDSYTIMFKKEKEYTVKVMDRDTQEVLFERKYNITRRSFWDMICDWLKIGKDS